MESRIQILDRLAHKWSRNNPSCIAVDTFEEWLKLYDSEATVRLVHIAMQEYAKPVKNLNEATVKRSEICSSCGGINTLVDGSLCKDCQVKLSECKSSEAQLT